jgi:hypothetical protein
MNEKRRTASDVLLELEAKVNELLALSRNHDNLLKLLLNRNSNKIIDNLPNVIEKPLPKPLIPGLKPGVVMTSAGLGIKENNEEFPTVKAPKTVKVINSEEAEPEFIDVENVPKGKRRTARYSSEEGTSKKTAVHQRILYPDGKNVCLASVEIMDSKNNVIKQLRTNPTGKWMAALEPGTYIVNISKQNVMNKPNVNISFEVDIPQSAEPIELPSPEVN